MAKPVDLELKKAFVELQVKMVESTKKIHEINSQLLRLGDKLKPILMTKLGLSTIPLDTRTYVPVGRMFLLTDLEDFEADLENRESEIGERSTELINNKEYLEKNLKESEDNIREMVQQIKEQSETKSK